MLHSFAGQADDSLKNQVKTQIIFKLQDYYLQDGDLFSSLFIRGYGYRPLALPGSQDLAGYVVRRGHRSGNSFRPFYQSL